MPNDKQLIIKQPVRFAKPPPPPALGTLFCDTHLYVGVGGYRLP